MVLRTNKGNWLNKRMAHHLKLLYSNVPNRPTFMCDGKHIDAFDDNPLKIDGEKSERLVIKDLPATVHPHVVRDFLKGYPQLKMRSKVIYAKERIGGEEMSPFINGDRFVYVSPDVTPPLPKETVIAGHPCRIWHPSQKNFYKRCASHGHRTVDVDICESYEADCVVAAFRADRNPLSNYYMSNITYADINYKSVEHYYQSEFCHHCGRDDVAQQVYDAPTPCQAKEIATKLKSEVHIDYMASWTKIKVSIMERTLDFLLYYFIVSNQSFLLIKICNTIDIFYQMKGVEMNHIFTGLNSVLLQRINNI